MMRESFKRETDGEVTRLVPYREITTHLSTSSRQEASDFETTPAEVNEDEASLLVYAW